MGMTNFFAQPNADGLVKLSDIHSATPAHTVVAAGQHLTATTEQDTHLLAQRHHAWAVKDGIGLFTHGQATDTQASGQHPVTDTGIRLHAASGNVSVQAQSAALNLTAKQAVDLQSTQASVHISAPQRIVLNGAGSYLLIDGGNIELGTSGPAQFKAAAKELAGGSSASGQGPSLNKAQDLFDEQFQLRDELSGLPLAGEPYRILNAHGTVLATGLTNSEGKTMRYTSKRAENLRLVRG